jgi:predicted phosphoribosyltransferase
VRFADRLDAGTRLARRLGHLAGQDVVVLGLPRGGVPVAAPVAASLGAPLDVLVVRKLGVPFQPELALGAIGEGGALVLDERVARAVHAGVDVIEGLERRERPLLDRATRRYRAVRDLEPVAGRTVVIVDDGAATGSTARVACRVARARGALRVVVAVPTCARSAVDTLRPEADELIVLERSPRRRSVAESYDDFTPVSEAEVVAALSHQPAAGSTGDPVDRGPQAAASAEGAR